MGFANKEKRYIPEKKKVRARRAPQTFTEEFATFPQNWQLNGVPPLDIDGITTVDYMTTTATEAATLTEANFSRMNENLNRVYRTMPDPSFLNVEWNNEET